MHPPRLAVLALLVLPALPASPVAQSDARPAVAAPIVSGLIVPNVPDVMIKTRRTSDRRAGMTMTETLHLKGGRQRREERLEAAPMNGLTNWASNGPPYTRITQCDERRTLILNQDAKTYAYDPIVDPAEFMARVRAQTAGDKQAPAQQAPTQQTSTPQTPSERTPPPQATARPTVTVTVDAVDTGERKQVGPLVARHVITTRTIDHGAGNVNIERQDGWYVDVPEPNCTTSEANAAYAMLVPTMTMLPHVKVNERGKVPRGYPIEETFQVTGRYATVGRTELIEVSGAPLDPALFTFPADFRPALPHPYGGYDLSRPDTILNRVQAFREVVADWTNYILRYGFQGILPGTTPPARY
jgi:hypothetical protein